MSWEKLPPIKGQVTCFTCGTDAVHLEMGDVIAVGFGAVSITRDQGSVDGFDSNDEQMCIEVDKAERFAASDPDHDWRLSAFGPMSTRVYQRQGPGLWVLVEQEVGFA